MHLRHLTACLLPQRRSPMQQLLQPRPRGPGLTSQHPPSALQSSACRLTALPPVAAASLRRPGWRLDSAPCLGSLAGAARGPVSGWLNATRVTSAASRQEIHVHLGTAQLQLLHDGRLTSTWLIATTPRIALPAGRTFLLAIVRRTPPHAAPDTAEPGRPRLSGPAAAGHLLPPAHGRRGAPQRCARRCDNRPHRRRPGCLVSICTR